MTCPYCHADYTFDDPCWCRLPFQTHAGRGPDTRPAEPGQKQPRSPLEPTGLQNPFWKN